MWTACRYRVPAIAVAALSTAACHPPAGNRAEEARRAIAGVIGKSVEATRNQDIESFMALIPPDLVLVDEAGARITREQLRANL